MRTCTYTNVQWNGFGWTADAIRKRMEACERNVGMRHLNAFGDKMSFHVPLVRPIFSQTTSLYCDTLLKDWDS